MAQTGVTEVGQGVFGSATETGEYAGRSVTGRGAYVQTYPVTAAQLLAIATTYAVDVLTALTIPLIPATGTRKGRRRDIQFLPIPIPPRRLFVILEVRVRFRVKLTTEFVENPLRRQEDEELLLLLL